ncbi:MAG: hypothetical protein J6T63_07565 [Bacteroidales bacterium]|nr:hypothetical protein [Bacteroidales bacterium]
MRLIITIIVTMFLLTMPFLRMSAQGTYTDTRDKSTYKVIEIGNKVWMAENLRYLPAVSPSGNLSIDDYNKAKYYVYGYDGNSVDEAKATQEYKVFGVLYNMTAAKKACPAGWHLAKDSEWKSLEKALGMSGKQIKDIGNRGDDQGQRMAGDTSLWFSYGQVKFKSGPAFGSSGFMALPAGFLGANGKFLNMGTKARFWTSTEYCDGFSYFRSIGITSLSVYRNNDDDRCAMSVRCVKD